MTTIASSFCAALLLIGARLAFQAFARRRRASRFGGLELRPNCLLTRYPIAFIARPPSIFRLFDDWRDVPLFLREHGYEVFVIEPLKRDDITASVVHALDATPRKLHLIASAEFESTLTHIARLKHPMASSLTVVKKPRAERVRTTSRLSIEDLKPLDFAIENFEVREARKSERFAFESRFLDLAISLAERDAMMSD